MPFDTLCTSFALHHIIQIIKKNTKFNPNDDELESSEKKFYGLFLSL